MATLEELQQQQFAQTIIPGLQEMVQPQNVPTGAQLAPGFTAPQTQAANILQQGLGSYQPFLTAGGQALSTALQTTGPQAVQDYMNPFTEAVADTTMTDLNRLFGQQRAAQAQRQIQTGGFAGSGTRGAVADAELARAQGDAAAKALASLRFGSARDAMKAQQLAGKTQAGIGQIFGGLGRTAQAGLFGDVGQLFDIGEAERQIIGAQNLGQFQTPFYGLGQFANILSGMPTPQQFQSPNPILTGIAAAGAVGNLFG
tara:strand:+ start:478 stop:1248 length:771 start_codon:yes stop_codon:yes gene_type:complete